jgi:hypothetical protein
MKTTPCRFFSALVFIPCLIASSSWAVTVGQVDTFEDGTTQGWVAGVLGAVHPVPPANALGGPAGANDNYLLLTSLAEAARAPG